ncbi:hypothetical protein N7466_005001 [Penicillium verhagenii]|uniref:uncharacterized protein n=1 Tax=Penicillium verhagenii TaxID=1562060 RepID=UPI0025458230|nr:uncharacterized protein N7466_005001 [Penicillium verhagenii]KAJ5935454.1 hypothetical protein N7466_005001 [Penicillium verhagenii]
MARLNAAKSQTLGSPRKACLTTQASQLPTTQVAGDLGSGARYFKSPTPKPKKGAGILFDIFSDEDLSFESTGAGGDQSSSFISPSRQKKSRTLKLTRTNSLLLPSQQRPQQRPRQRPSDKLETEDYEKENDLTEYGTDTNSPTMSPAPQRSTIRRSTARTPRSNTTARSFSRLSPEVEDEDSGNDSFASLEDFIVSDNEELSSHETSDSETEEVQRDPTPSPPRTSPRKRLMRGRRPGFNLDQNVESKYTPSEPFHIEVKLPGSVKLPSNPPVRSNETLQDDLDLSTKLEDLELNGDNESTFQVETESTPSIIELDSSPPPLKPTNKRPQTPPPSSPSRSRFLKSPTKERTRIPPTPHRESVDAFWSQEETNDWVDHHSPRKQKTPGRSVIDLLRDFGDSDNEGSSQDTITSTDSDSMTRVTAKEAKTPSKTALKKAETEARKAAKARRLSFDNKKADFAETFLNVLDNAVAGGRVSQLAEKTGGVKIIWSKTLQKTAGRAHWQGINDRDSNGRQIPGTTTHHAKIELAERIIDNEYRLLNTLAHEYCHLANYMVSKCHDNPHGTSFKLWGKKCAEALKDHPIYGGQINVTTKHSYQIDYKYVWACVSCGQTYGRHSKSIDTARVCCGACNNKLEQIKPKPRNVSPRKNPATPAFQKKIVDDVTRDLGRFVL